VSSLPIKIYSGYDPRESVGWHAFSQSLIDTSHGAVELVTLNEKLTDLAPTDGTNLFTKARFLVPYLNRFLGFALFVDGVDMLLKDDVSKVLDDMDHYYSVSVVRHYYKTKNPRKYLGTELETDNQDYPKKNWSSVMLFNCAHYACKKLTPEFVSKTEGSKLHDFSWVPEGRLGTLDPKWNWLVDEYGENEEAKLLHWTAGIPAFRRYRGAPHAQEWFETLNRTREGLQ